MVVAGYTQVVLEQVQERGFGSGEANDRTQ
jgi:hypothetical protein